MFRKLMIAVAVVAMASALVLPASAWFSPFGFGPFGCGFGFSPFATGVSSFTTTSTFTSSCTGATGFGFGGFGCGTPFGFGGFGGCGVPFGGCGLGGLGIGGFGCI
ncbi:hypothetical protein MCP_1548 [Methanocella paludicola SANAE]|uniref:Uncharacterized protein n=1 Tax=Methanocella paludicola (strain DSM 17711 / JCM 13418 / NBRC 101707 / SANAE) TaxID=304371 RepID=D1YYU8_METPS|nr:hypothetical protein [Methanocella paludicola]BAI61620.1 hypothetical protein MCP_1548 [Methanocella paludicola SANAE]